MKKIIYLFSVIFIAGIITNILYGINLSKQVKELSIVEMQPEFNKLDLQEVRFQSASVPCMDTENYGSGSNRDRVCAHGTTAFCDWEDWSAPGNIGSCSLDGDSGGPSDPEHEG